MKETKVGKLLSAGEGDVNWDHRLVDDALKLMREYCEVDAQLTEDEAHVYNDDRVVELVQALLYSIKEESLINAVPVLESGIYKGSEYRRRAPYVVCVKLGAYDAATIGAFRMRAVELKGVPCYASPSKREVLIYSQTASIRNTVLDVLRSIDVEKFKAATLARRFDVKVLSVRERFLSGVAIAASYSEGTLDMVTMAPDTFTLDVSDKDKVLITESGTDRKVLGCYLLYKSVDEVGLLVRDRLCQRYSQSLVLSPTVSARNYDVLLDLVRYCGDEPKVTWAKLVSKDGPMLWVLCKYYEWITCGFV